jgi:hypothetical protein
VMIGLAYSFFKALRSEVVPAPEPRPAAVEIPEPPAPRPSPGIAGGS